MSNISISNANNFNFLNKNQKINATTFVALKIPNVSVTNLERFWFAKQSNLPVLARSKFVCVPGQIKMAPPLGPLLAQFLSGLAAEFITFLSGTVDFFQKGLTDGQEIVLDFLSVKLFKFKTEELRLSISFSVVQNLFHSTVLHEVVEAWKSSFGMLDRVVFGDDSEVDLEQARLFLKNSLKLELQGFLLVNLYLLLCGWFVNELVLKAEQAHEFLIFTKKPVSAPVLPLFNLHDSLSNRFNGLPYALFVQLFRSTIVIYRSLSVCFNQKGARTAAGRRKR